MEAENQPKFVRETPAQEKSNAKINLLNSQIASVKSFNNSGLSAPVSHKEVKALYDSKKAEEKNLKRLQRKAKWERNKRIKVKDTLTELSKSNPNLKFMTRGISGRPRIETEQPQLLSTILGKFGK